MATHPSHHRAAVILCGGLSSRMGRPKAWLPFGEETLLQRVVRLVGGVCDERVVVAAADQDLPALPGDVTVVRDAVPEQGPLAGLAAGLSASEAPAAICLPCDTPFIRAALVTGLFDALGDADAVRPVVGDFPQPLMAVYRTSLGARAHALVREERRRLVFLVEDRPVVDLPPGQVLALDPEAESFRNCNTPREYAECLRMAGYAS